MLFRYSFDRPELDQRIQAAVTDVLRQARTADIQAPGTRLVGCREMGERVLAALAAQPAPTRSIPVPSTRW